MTSVVRRDFVSTSSTRRSSVLEEIRAHSTHLNRCEEIRSSDKPRLCHHILHHCTTLAYSFQLIEKYRFARYMRERESEEEIHLYKYVCREKKQCVYRIWNRRKNDREDLIELPVKRQKEHNTVSVSLYLDIYAQAILLIISFSFRHQNGQRKSNAQLFLVLCLEDSDYLSGLVIVIE